ncbi:glycoside hydrolase family 43 protein [Aliifodinibius sp. S!AR15-10]|uniref:glycoside hydrolase family 43 protein n=1 Tax=Aliifodinibius sp. S!AR15-10 TaxID=2950437 RepID=UPI002865F727|nr:glycoside hydrolase family 43 protein [Aliifodinibius sp. S!AR15-10]MDR8394131.1 glycoside hydrolase family 43 protein [Aliifodinibius sp. S!AR15-10]
MSINSLSRVFGILILIIGLLASTKPLHAQTVPEDTVLLYSYFTGNGEDGLHLAYSRDAYKWEALNEGESILTPTAGGVKLMRDPCIIRGGDGKFHMVWTVSWNEKGIGYASSEDLVNWSEQQFLPVMEHEEKALNSWAPEITYDEENDQYMIYWATTIPGRFPSTAGKGDDNYNHRMYYSVTSDFESFSETKLLYDQGFNVIDATVKPLEDQYVMFLKNETRWPPEKNLRVAFGESLTGPYGEASQPITGEYWAEGPTALKLGNRWIVYFDKYRQGQMGAVTSTDLENWQDISDKVSFPEGMRHGTIFKVSEEEFKQLQKNLSK